MDSIQATILRAKLPHLDEYNEARRKAANTYSSKFKGVKNIITPQACYNPNSSCGDTCNCHVFHQYTLRVLDVDRDALVKHLGENNIPCGVYYPIPLHLQKAYKAQRYVETDFAVTNQLEKEVISLPMHTELDDEQIDFIASTVLNFVNKS